ncbi:uncharacterized protein [Ptychodera flava]|uniref:uncharacterized protein n=1 Tax=Ptychodera flava TaxID=63121 RepID=UPI00396A4393
MIRDKLPNNIRKQIARDHGNKAWTLPELRKAILREIDAIQAGVPLDELSVLNSSTQPCITAAFHTNVDSTRSPMPPRIETCVYCNGNHYTSHCQVITDTIGRLDIVKRDRLCYNCLGRHRVSNCKSRFTCKICQRKHHSPLHVTESCESTTEPEKSDTCEVQVTLAKTDITQELSSLNPPVLLKTAVIPMTTRDGNSINATVLFDEGSNRTFVTQRFADKLNVKPNTSVNVHLSTFGNYSKQIRAMNSATLSLHELDGNITALDALIIPEISSNLPNYISTELHNTTHLRGLHFAHPVSNAKSIEVDVLIAADQYWNFVGDHIVRGVGPTAVLSKFGYLLSGPIESGRKSDFDITTQHVNSEAHNVEHPIEINWDLQ